MTNEAQGFAIEARLILYHSQSTSARTLFLRHESGSVIAPEPLPPLSMLLDEGEFTAGRVLHPAALIRHYCDAAGLPPSLLQAEGDFHQRVETPRHILNIYLARFTCIDPPRQMFADRGGKFCAITELRGGHPAEMALLQRAYQAIMG
jgi:hypothetical protein